MGSFAETIRLCAKLITFRWFLFFGTAVFALIATLTVVFQGSRDSFSMGDVFGLLFLGTEPIDFFNTREVFKVPLLWLSFLIFTLLTTRVISQPKAGNIAQTIFMAARTRLCHWHVVALTTMLGMVIHFLVLLSVVALFCLILKGELSFMPTDSFVEANLQSLTQPLTATTFFIHAFAIPLLASIVIATFQSCLVLFFTIPKGLLCIVVLLIVSVYLPNYLLLGNYLMLLRNDVFDPFGLNVTIGLLIMLMCVTGSYVVGRIKVKSWDFIS